MTTSQENLLSENTALRIECEAQEAEIAQLKNFLQQTVSKPDLYSEKQRVSLSKGLSALPEKAWQKIVDDVPQVDDFLSTSILEEQLAERNKLLSTYMQEVSDLRSLTKEEGPRRLNHGEENAAHLLEQIYFLHSEVERLEKQVISVRAAGKEELRSIEKKYGDKLEQKDKEVQMYIEQLRGHSRKNRLMDGEDLVSRCKVLENQLAIALSEKNSLIVEKNDLAMKVRKMETTLKERKHEMVEAQRQVSQESSASSSQLKNLQEVIQVLSDERTMLRKQLNNLIDKQGFKRDHIGVQTSELLVSTLSQTDSPTFTDKECQAESATTSNQDNAQSIQKITHMLEIKCAECDDLRAQVANLSSVHMETLGKFETAKKRLSEEIERKKLLGDDAEKLSLQVRSLQQKCSQQVAVERELNGRLLQLEEQKRQLRISTVNVEQEKHAMEEQLQQYQKDMEQLLANKNYCNQQVDQLSRENENLRMELQKLHQVEAQLMYSVKAKDGELKEILSAYQNAVREVDLHNEGQRTIDRELESTRATLASKEQAIFFLQEQLNQLHHKDQQVSLDLQAFEYENSQLHRKAVQSEALVTQLESRCDDLQQLSLSKDRVTDELQQNLSELSKQIVLKENECMLLRHRCDALQRDSLRLQSAHEIVTRRLRELEETNARLVVQGVIGTENDEKYISLQNEMESVKRTLHEKSETLIEVQKQLRIEKEEKMKCGQELDAVRASLEEVLLSKERLQQVVLDQATTLSHLSR